MDKNLPANEGNIGLIPVSGRFHMPWGKACAPLLQSMHLEPILYNKRSHHNEKPAHSNADPVQPKLNK